MKFIKTYFILLILLSCSKDNQKKESLYNKNIQQVSLEDFNIDKEITGKILNVDYKTEFHEILSIDTLLILKTSSRHKEFFKIYNLNTLEHLGDVGVRGEGPEEWKNVDINHVLTKENDNYMIWVTDRFNGFLKKINLSKSLSLNTVYPVYEKKINVNASKFPFSSIFHFNNRLVADIGYEDDTNSRFKTMNLENGEIIKTNLFPLIENYSKFQSQILFNFYIGDFRKHPIENKFVSAMAKLNRIDFLDSNLEPFKSIVDGENWKDNFFDARKIDVKTADMYKMTDGYYATSVSENYVFTKWGYDYKLDEPPLKDISIIKVFDWKGNPIVILRLDCVAYATTFNEKNKILYVNDSKNEHILMYDLTNLL